MKKVQKTYSAEFKQEAVRLMQTSGKPIAHVARELGISDTSLHQWRKELAAHGTEAFPGSGHQTAKARGAASPETRTRSHTAGAGHFKKSLDGLFKNVKEIYAFIAAHQQEYPVKTMCRVLSVSQSGFYAWRKRQPSQRQVENAWLTEQIRQAFERGRQVYGSPRIHAELRGQGISCGKHRVVRLMRQAGLQAIHKRRRRLVTTDSRHSDPIAPNLLGRDFTASAPNQKWLTDLTAVWTAQGWLYLAVVLDVYSRLVVGWAMASHREESLVEAALWMALGRRQPIEKLLHHTDRGSQYTSLAYQSVLAQFRMQVSMSGKGDCYDNAMLESFFASLKTECVHRYTYQSHAEAQSSIFEWIEVFYNRQRRHSSLKYLSPAAYEQQGTCVL
jgi:putative transposase